MTDVMQRCVPISNGILAPDLRVNYQFGLVLGVDEFEQEDRYLRERDERAARVLHGYGTATGLHVSAARPAAAPLDVEARVEPGVAIDQWGRPVVVRSAQCARIGAWIAEQETAALAAGTTSPLVTYRRPSGDVTVYVVASYAECDDALVPIPGNPCADDDDLLAASRIRDSWQLELRWEPPAMPAWDGIRALADLLAGVDTHDASPFDSDEDILAVSPSVVEADARVRLDELNRRFNYGLPPSDDFDTIGGFAFSHIGRMPAAGETLDWERLRITILVADARRIQRVRIELLDQAPNGESN